MAVQCARVIRIGQAKKRANNELALEANLVFRNRGGSLLTVASGIQEQCVKDNIKIMKKKRSEREGPSNLWPSRLQDLSLFEYFLAGSVYPPVARLFRLGIFSSTFHCLVLMV